MLCKQVWSGHSGGVKEDAQMTLSFSLEEAFSGPIQGAFCTAADYGKIQLYLDGVALGEPVDCYATEVLHSGLKTLGEVTLEAGAHELQIKVVGKNDASKGYLFGLDCLVFGEHVLTRKAATEATCISVGYPDHWACADCDKVFEDKYGTTEIAGGGLELIVKPLDSGGSSDPLDQRASVAWKATRAAVRLQEAYMVRIETTSTFTSAI